MHRSPPSICFQGAPNNHCPKVQTVFRGWLAGFSIATQFAHSHFRHKTPIGLSPNAAIAPTAPMPIKARPKTMLVRCTLRVTRAKFWIIWFNPPKMVKMHKRREQRSSTTRRTSRHRRRWGRIQPASMPAQYCSVNNNKSSAPRGS